MPAIDPPASPIEFQTFDEAAMERLDALLLKECGPSGGLPLEAVDGLFSAALVSPGEPISFQEACEKALHGMPDLPSTELIGLLFALWAWISWRVTQPASEDDPGLSMPILAWPLLEEGEQIEKKDYPLGGVWAIGFAMGSSLREAEWQARMHEHEMVCDDLAEIFSLMPKIEGMATLQYPRPDSEGYGMSHEEIAMYEQMQADGFNIDMVKRLQIVELLPDILNEFHCLCEEEYELQHQQSPDDPAAIVNAECPCGSGLPFKSCHGNPARLN